MAKIYAKKVKAGTITIDEVPNRWKEQVIKLLFE